MRDGGAGEIPGGRSRMPGEGKGQILLDVGKGRQQSVDAPMRAAIPREILIGCLATGGREGFP